MQTVNTLRHIEEGMKVFDRERHEIGKVEYVQFGDDDPETPEVEAAAPNTLDRRDRTLVDDIAKAQGSKARLGTRHVDEGVERAVER